MTEWAFPTCKVVADNGSNMVAAFHDCCDESEDEKDNFDSDGKDFADFHGYSRI